MPIILTGDRTTGPLHLGQRVIENVIEVALDYLAVGIDPLKSTIFIQ